MPDANFIQSLHNLSISIGQALPFLCLVPVTAPAVALIFTSGLVCCLTLLFNRAPPLFVFALTQTLCTIAGNRIRRPLSVLRLLGIPSLCMSAHKYTNSSPPPNHILNERTTLAHHIPIIQMGTHMRCLCSCYLCDINL